MRNTCIHCERPREFVPGKGWIHTGGTAYIMECPDCGWQGFQPATPLTYATDICPNCKVQGKLRDNHVCQ